MIAPVNSPLHTAAPTTNEANAPIRVRRLGNAPVQACTQKSSITGLYVSQTATLNISGERRTFSTGHLLVLSGDTILRVEQAVDVWVFEFRWEALTPFLSSPNGTSTWRQFAATLDASSEGVNYYLVPDEERGTWQRCLQTLDQELRTERFGYCESAKAYLTLLLVSLVRVLEEKNAFLPLADDPLVAKVLAYIEVHLREPLTLEAVARHVHRSPSYLTTRVREQIGQSVMDYVIGRRIQEAETLLKTTDNPVSAIGEAVGYPEPSDFSRQFRKRYGLSPSAWREANR